MSDHSSARTWVTARESDEKKQAAAWLFIQWITSEAVEWEVARNPDEEKRLAMGRQALAASANGDAAVKNNYALAARYLSDSRDAAAPVA